MSLSQTGKALLTVENDGGSLYSTINCLTGIDKDDHGGQDWLWRTVQELADFCDWLPPLCYKMKDGDKCVFKLNFYQSYYKGSWGYEDDDEDLEFYNVRKIQHVRGKDMSRKALKKFYQPKNKAKFGGKIKLSKKQEKELGFI
jgi:hypothetical protein